MKKYLMLAVMALAAVGMFLTGCSNGGSSGSDDPTPSLCTVTFDANGHGIAPEPIINVRAGQQITLPKMENDGEYVNVGWYFDADCQVRAGSVNEAMTVDDSVTLYGKWTDGKVKISWNLNYDGAPAIEPTEQNIGEKIEYPTNPAAQAGIFAFKGWATSSVNGEADLLSADALVPEEDITYYAQWGYEIQITWKNGDEIYKTTSQKAYDNLSLPAKDSTWTNFVGWFTEPVGGEPVGSAWKVKPATYYAHFGVKLILKGDKYSGSYSYDGNGSAMVAAGDTKIVINSLPHKAMRDSSSSYYRNDPAQCPINYYIGNGKKIADAFGNLIPNVKDYTDKDGKWIGSASEVTLLPEFVRTMGCSSAMMGPVPLEVFYIDTRECVDNESKDKIKLKSDYIFFDYSGWILNSVETGTSIKFTDRNGNNTSAYRCYYKGDADTYKGDRYYVVFDRYMFDDIFSSSVLSGSTGSYTYYGEDSYVTEDLSSVVKGKALKDTDDPAKYIGYGKTDTAAMLAYDGGKYVTKSTSDHQTIWKMLNVCQTLAESPWGGSRDIEWFKRCFIPSSSELYFLKESGNFYPGGDFYSSSVGAEGKAVCYKNSDKSITTDNVDVKKRMVLISSF